MSVALDIPHGMRVAVRYLGKWYGAAMIENVKDNDRFIVVRTDERCHCNDFLEGHGLTVGYRSDDILQVPLA